ncbi:MAG TPA: DNA polymerase domain-containing protein [Allocoleopsis sp.]
MDAKIEEFYRKPLKNFNEESLIFQSLDWTDSNEILYDLESDTDTETDIRRYIIKVFGVSKNGNSVCLLIENFTPFFYIKVPDTWSSITVKSFLDKISNNKFKQEDSWYDVGTFIDRKQCRLFKKKDFYGFTNGEKFTFLRLVFLNSLAMNRTINAITSHNNGKVKILGYKNSFQLYETKIDPILRFIHLRGLQPTGWLKVDDFVFISNNKESTCQIECRADWKDISGIEDLESAPILQASFDIEVMNEDCSFNPEIKENVIFQIATSFKYFGKENFLVKHIICLKNCSKIESNDGVPVIVECYNTEKEVLLAWKKLLIRMDPDILYQYNGDWFDGHYLYIRSKILGISSSFLNLGKLKEVKAYIKESSFQSSAYGNNKYRRLVIPGRINFDIMIYVKREYKETSWKLDDIAKKFLGSQKNPVTAKQMFEYFRSGNPDLIKIVAEYCIKDTLLPQQLADKLNILQNQISMSNITFVPIKYLIERGQMIKVYSQILKETSKRDFLIPTINKSDDNEEESFEGATVLDPEKGAYFVPITTLDFASLYPSIIRAHNLCFSTIVLDPKYSDIPGVEYYTMEWTDKKTGKYHNYRYAQSIDGLLPILLKELALSRKKYKKLMVENQGTYMEEIYNKCQLAVKVSMNSVYGFLAAPMLCCKPIAATVTAVGREMIMKTKDYVEKNYEGCIAVYGDTDSCFIKLKTKTTEEYVKNLNLNKDPELIEKLKKKCIEESIHTGKEIANKITKELFKNPIQLEYEKVFCPLLLLSKKRYVGRLYTEDSDNYKLKNSGLVLTRRDNFRLLKIIYNDILNTLVSENVSGIEKAKQMIYDVCEKLDNGGISLDDLVMTKTLKGMVVKETDPTKKEIFKVEGYKAQNSPHLVLAKKIAARDPGNTPVSNDRVPYVFIHPRYIPESKNGKKKIAQYLKVEDPEYVKKHELDLDTEYYIKFMSSSVCELLSIFMDNPEDIFKEYILKSKSKN